MAKNMIRKGLAIASASSIALFGLGAPAFGAQADTTKVSLAPATGDEYGVIAGALNTLKLEANEAVNIQGGDLSFLIEDADAEVFPVLANANTTGYTGTNVATAVTDTWARTAAGVVTVSDSDGAADNTFDDINVGDIIFIAAGALPDAGGAGAVTTVPSGYYTVTAATDGDGAATAAVSSFSFVDGFTEVLAGQAAAANAAGVVDGVTRDADNNFVIDTGINVAATDEVLTLTTMSSDTVSVTVTAWVDDNNDGEIGATEYASPARVVTFYGADDITVSSITWDAALTDAAVSADVTFGQSINWTQTITNLAGTFSNAGDVFGAATETDDEGTITIASTLGGDNSLDAGRLTLSLANDTGDAIHVARTTIDDNDVASVAVAFATGNNVAQSVDNGDVTVREAASTVTATVTVLDSDDVAVSGATVVVEPATANGTSLDADAVVKVNGNVVDVDDNDFTPVELVTDANGEATITITSTDGTATDVLDLKVSSEGIATDGTTVSTDITLTWTAASYFAIRAGNIVDADDDALATTFWLGEGNSTTFSFAMFDQWGVAPSSGDYRVKATVAQGDLDDAFKYSVFNSAGVANISVTDLEELGENVTVTLALQGWDEDGDTWIDGEADVANANDGIDAVVLTLTTGDNTEWEINVDAFVAQAAGNANDDLATPDPNELEAASSRLGDADPDPADAAGAGGGVGAEYIEISGDVTDALNGSDYAGGMVTISGSSNLLFVNTAGQNGTNYEYAFGSLSAVLDANGEFDFTVLSNVAGEYEVTITSGGVSETVDIEIDAAADPVDDAEITFAAAAYSPAASTWIATVYVKDAFGNPIEIAAADANLEVEWDGPGLISGNLPTSTDDEGKARVFILFGANETGSGTLTVTYAGADGNIATATDNVSEEFTVTLGEEPAPAADTKVNAGSFKGYVAIYAKGHAGKRLSAKVGNDWVVVPALASNFVRVVEYTGAGYTISVRIYIDRVLVDTIVVTTK